MQIGYDVFPVFSGSVHFTPNCIGFVFSCDATDKLSIYNHSIQLWLTLFFVIKKLLEGKGQMEGHNLNAKQQQVTKNTKTC